MRISFFWRWLISLWIFIWGDDILEWFFDITPEDAFLIAAILAVVVFFILSLLNWYYSPDRQIQREEVPGEPRQRPGYEPPPIRTELQTRPMILQDLQLIIQSDNPGEPKARIGIVVRPDDTSIRPYAVVWVNQGAGCIGKKTTLQFSILGPRKRKPNQQFGVRVTFQAGRNDFWPKDSEFPIQGHHREEGDWRLQLDIVTSDGGLRHWHEADFRIVEEIDMRTLVGDDAALKVPRNVAAAEVADRTERPRIDDLLS